MADIKPYIDDDGEVRELDEHFFKRAKRGRPPMTAEARKRRVQLMLDPDVLMALQTEGRGVSTRANAILRAALGL